MGISTRLRFFILGNFPFFLPWKSAVKLFPSPVGFLNFTFLSVHHAMPFLIKVIGVLVSLSMRYNSKVSKEKIKLESQVQKLSLDE